LLIFRRIAAALAVALGVLSHIAPAVAQDGARLKQAAQHFADLEDDQAKMILEELSAEGVTEADVLLGYLHSDPLYAGRDDQLAISYFERAAEKDHPEAVFQLAESRYWPGYLDPKPGVPVQILDAGIDEVYRLLRRAIELKHGTAVFRLALLCIYQGYDCTEDEVEMSLNVRTTAIGGGVRYLADPFSAHRLLKEEEDSLERSGRYHDTLELGLSYLNPLVATVWGSDWQHVTAAERCPSIHHPGAVIRMFGAMNGVARPFPESLSLADCYSPEEMAALKQKVSNLLDGTVTLLGTFQVGYINWCFEYRSGRASAACLATAAFDEYFSCAKLSLFSYSHRHGFGYGGSDRHRRCREHMLAARGQ
jgi:tetratricopeptide (TPR) repeat protein